MDKIILDIKEVVLKWFKENDGLKNIFDRSVNMIEQFRNLKSDIPDNQQLALKLNEVICALSAMEAATTAVQRLKAEIAVFAYELLTLSNKHTSSLGDFSRLSEKLRQLSAV